MPDLYVTILDEEVIQAPTAVAVTVVEGLAETALTIDIDGTVVWEGFTDSEGTLAPTSVNVPVEVGDAGTHTLTAVQVGATSGTATFTLQRDPAQPDVIVGPDADPVEIPASLLPSGLRRWVLQDLQPGGLGSYVMPHNPESMSSPYLEREYDVRPTTAGFHHVSEGAARVIEWTFQGFAHTAVFAQKLLDYGNLRRRFYVIDHRGRAFKVIFSQVELTPRLRQNVDGQLVDGQDYVVTALVLDQEWSDL